MNDILNGQITHPLFSCELILDFTSWNDINKTIIMIIILFYMKSILDLQTRIEKTFIGVRLAQIMLKYERRKY